MLLPIYLSIYHPPAAAVKCWPFTCLATYHSPAHLPSHSSLTLSATIIRNGEHPCYCLTHLVPPCYCLTHLELEPPCYCRIVCHSAGTWPPPTYTCWHTAQNSGYQQTLSASACNLCSLCLLRYCCHLPPSLLQEAPGSAAVLFLLPTPSPLTSRHAPAWLQLTGEGHQR